MPTPTPTSIHSDSDPDSDAAPIDDLAAERAHLAGSRAALARMRARTASLDSSAAGDWVSRQFLESAIYRRMKALEDDPTVPLFFGRLDYSELAKTDEDFAGADFHIGRRHVHDDNGTPVVLDWRAPVSRGIANHGSWV